MIEKMAVLGHAGFGRFGNGITPEPVHLGKAGQALAMQFPGKMGPGPVHPLLGKKLPDLGVIIAGFKKIADLVRHIILDGRVDQDT